MTDTHAGGHAHTSAPAPDTNATVNANAQAELARTKEARDRSWAQYEVLMQGKPTPTQEENDLAALGAHVTEKEPDGSALDPNQRDPYDGPPNNTLPEGPEGKRKQSEPRRPLGAGGDYQTRQSRSVGPQHPQPDVQHDKPKGP